MARVSFSSWSCAEYNSGKATGNEIRFKMTFNDQTFQMTAKRMPN
jgi:hypothetical protein